MSHRKLSALSKMCPTAQAPPRPSSHQTKAYICLTHARKLSEGHTTDKMACSPLPSVPLMCQPLSWMPLRQKQGLGHGYSFEIKVKVFKSLPSDLEPTSPPPKGSASCRMEATSILIQGDKRSQQAAGASKPQELGSFLHCSPPVSLGV